MKTTINKDSYKLLFLLFQASAMLDTLDDMDKSEPLIKNQKKNFTIFKKQLTNGITKHLNKAYDIGEDEFKAMDDSISYHAEIFGKSSILKFLRIKD